jgi:CDP-diacylglycerol--glycerol-3-phosphate 3-phosphatidyltransferase
VGRFVNLYASKNAINGQLTPLVERMWAAGITADQVTLAAIPVASIGAGALLLSTAQPLALLAVPPLVALRLLLNLLDGQLARLSGRTHPRGELFNEVGDRLADVAFLAPVAFLPGASAPIVLFGVVAALMASYVGVATRAAGGPRLYRGVLSKPGRMVALAAFSLWALAAGPETPWAVFGPVLLIGGVLTLGERLWAAVRALE